MDSKDDALDPLAWAGGEKKGRNNSTPVDVVSGPENLTPEDVTAGILAAGSLVATLY
jgi:hypothetical protein